MFPNPPKHKYSYHLPVVVCAAALVFGFNLDKFESGASSQTLPVPTTEASRTAAANPYGFTIQNVSIGMSRDSVEGILGRGDPEGSESVGYGKKWKETNPFDVERRELEIQYDDQDVVISVTGSSMSRNGVSVKPRGPEYELEEFGPSDGVGVAVRTGGHFDSAVMLKYPKAGVHIEYYNENRMWFTIVAPYGD